MFSAVWLRFERMIPHRPDGVYDSFRAFEFQCTDSAPKLLSRVDGGQHKYHRWADLS